MTAGSEGLSVDVIVTTICALEPSVWMGTGTVRRREDGRVSALIADIFFMLLGRLGDSFTIFGVSMGYDEDGLSDSTSVCML